VIFYLDVILLGDGTPVSRRRQKMAESLENQRIRLLIRRDVLREEIRNSERKLSYIESKLGEINDEFDMGSDVKKST